MDIKLKNLRYLIAVADTRHFGRAAERTFVSQIGSKQIVGGSPMGLDPRHDRPIDLPFLDCFGTCRAISEKRLLG
jgi:hypothetical protein